MATILDAVRSCCVEVYEKPIWEHRLAKRSIYVRPEFWNWVDNDERLHDDAHSQGGRTLFEHLEQAFCDHMCSAKGLGHGDLKRVSPTREGIWKIHSIGLRTFGWCLESGDFVVVCGGLIGDVKGPPPLYDVYKQKCLDFAKAESLEQTITLGDYLAIFA